MHEKGVDISKHYSKTLEELKKIHFDLIITVCDHAKETCPVLPGVKTIHHHFDDPPTKTKNEQDKNKILNVYRQVRDEIESFINKLDFDSI